MGGWRLEGVGLSWESIKFSSRAKSEMVQGKRLKAMGLWRLLVKASVTGGYGAAMTLWTVESREHWLQPAGREGNQD